ncbi:MAG: 3-oxoacyl-[acyl-carrier-protein] synthase III C-terminal domain-containing protein [Ignavibacteriales bacterium]
MAGIVGWGVFIPRMRIKAADYRAAWGSFGVPGILEKTVADVDDDSVTMAVNAASTALNSAAIDPSAVRAVVLASTSYPYEVKFQVGTVSRALGIPQGSAGLQFGGSSKAGTEALICARAMADLTRGYALVAVGDNRVASAYSPLEHASSAAGCALVLGSEGDIAHIEAMAHHTDDIPGDRFRPAGKAALEDVEVKEYTERHALRVVCSAAEDLLKVTGLTTSAFRHLAASEPNGRFMESVAKRLGFPADAMAFTNLAQRLGDTGACGGLLGLISAMEHSQPGDRIMLLSYGEGGGADALAIRLLSMPVACGLKKAIDSAEYIDLLTYLKIRNRIA